MVEEYLDGPEVSVFGITDGVTVVPLQPAQDCKRAFDGDEGPEHRRHGRLLATAVGPPKDSSTRFVRTVLQPTVDEVARRGTPLLRTAVRRLGADLAEAPRSLEFNARFGDPETQVVLARLVTPLARVLLASAEGRLAELPPLEWSADSAVTVVVAAHNYPGAPRTGDEIQMDCLPAQAISGVDVLHAGTRLRKHGAVVSSGGRVLSVTAVGPTLDDARAAVVQAGLIALEGSPHRRDIALAAAPGTRAHCR